MTTRPEFTHKRSLDFSQWIKDNLPDSSTGFCVGNLDWIFWNWKTKKLIIAEEKTHSAKLSRWFERFTKEILNPALNKFCEKKGIEYKGFHLIQFENTSPDNGKIYLDDQEIDIDVLKTYLGLEE